MVKAMTDNTQEAPSDAEAMREACAVLVEGYRQNGPSNWQAMVEKIRALPLPTTQPTDNTGLIEQVNDEADLCRNDGADDIASLLDEAAAALATKDAEIAAAKAEREHYRMADLELLEIRDKEIARLRKQLDACENYSRGQDDKYEAEHQAAIDMYRDQP